MFMDPVTLLASCNLQTTDTVADFGAGSGFLAKAALAYVPQGNVFAIEINRDMVTRLTREAAEANLKNFHPLWGDIEVAGGSKLADTSVDFILLSNTLFYLEDKNGVMSEALRVLKPGGRMLVVDWTESFGGMGPRPESVFGKDKARALLERHGLTILTDTLPAGEHHYAILCQK